MVWVVSGDTNAVYRLYPYFETMSRKILDLQTTNVAGVSILKVLGNFIIMSGKNVNNACKAGLGPQHLISWVDAFLSALVLMEYSRQLVGGAEDEARVNMAIGIATKDAGCVRC